MSEWLGERRDEVETCVVAPIDSGSVAAAHSTAGSRAGTLGGSTGDGAEILDALTNAPAACGTAGDVVAVPRRGDVVFVRASKGRRVGDSGVGQDRVVDRGCTGRVKQGHLGQDILDGSSGRDVAVDHLKSALCQSEVGIFPHLVVLGVG